MIRLISALPKVDTLSAEYLRIRCLYDAYRDDTGVLFWEQGEGQAFFALSDGNMTVYAPSADTEEIRSFLNMISPSTVFSDQKTLESLGLVPYQALTVLCRKADIEGEAKGDDLNSRELYDLFSAGGLALPDYPAFAVDVCRRLHHGGAAYFGQKETCAALTVFSGNAALLTGIVSRKKGCGTAALRGILQKNYGRTVLACCEEPVVPFYLKNGFRIMDHAGSWKYEY